jgi:hypothetical protein
MRPLISAQSYPTTSMKLGGCVYVTRRSTINLVWMIHQLPILVFPLLLLQPSSSMPLKYAQISTM